MQDDLIKHLQQGVVVLEFIKADQSVRRMRATLNTSYLPVRPEHAQAAKNNPLVIKVWDLDAQGWRSVTVSRLVSYTQEQGA